MRTLVYAAVAVLAAASGFGLYKAFIEPQLGAPTAEVRPDAAGDVGQIAQPSPYAVPEVLPDFTLTDVDGQPRSIRSWPGKSMIVNFWATWCAPCRREIPLLKEVQQTHGEEGFQLVGVAIDVREDVLKFAREIAIDYPLLIGEQDGLEAASKLGQVSLGLPFTVFTDDQHRIVAIHLGEIERAEMDVLLSAVRRVNAGELTPAAARVQVAKELAALPEAEA